MVCQREEREQPESREARRIEREERKKERAALRAEKRAKKSERAERGSERGNNRSSERVKDNTTIIEGVQNIELDKKSEPKEKVLEKHSKRSKERYEKNSIRKLINQVLKGYEKGSSITVEDILNKSIDLQTQKIRTYFKNDFHNQFFCLLLFYFLNVKNLADIYMNFYKVTQDNQYFNNEIQVTLNGRETKRKMDQPLFGEQRKQTQVYVVYILQPSFDLKMLVFSLAIGVFFGIKQPRDFVLVVTLLVILISTGLLVRWWRDRDDVIHPKFKYLLALLILSTILAGISVNIYAWQKAPLPQPKW
ncbi:hypothetical protein PPL_09712 [Heterostelium album PN500]|uniref:Uncharacterized protein n=1 Tax=Heterostelium pallidum (strain ATCC 26659 / Pp 5 / PN500) TaxID=670386 RepID=D3BNK9_HETP5|nr:hypothetical protein PPL_09712 [Heterostelium album PN500]EFA76960.1 hypothetical protein PPL_09712 [Heterostelium album PN500]|eukprot:XP_020429091.1 hypothetical protein PPL_09712 [Heterostelium album PN500]